ncbi:hypothetical protein MTR_8g038830 [Medicago truncatula]|uniref:Uncharacterized protein n=1 Tax=Medicago truncatula TaxID=3880 RepID=G7LFZ9_MEDTR|nr:hypothetical protein MTR_8g038830 [Medicago truncatula]
MYITKTVENLNLETPPLCEKWTIFRFCFRCQPFERNEHPRLYYGANLNLKFEPSDLKSIVIICYNMKQHENITTVKPGPFELDDDLTTGGLPTFVDVGNSFGVPNIVEIPQIRS